MLKTTYTPGDQVFLNGHEMRLAVDADPYTGWVETVSTNNPAETDLLFGDVALITRRETRRNAVLSEARQVMIEAAAYTGLFVAAYLALIVWGVS